MGYKLYLTEWNHFLKSMVLLINYTAMAQANEQAEPINRVFKKAIQSAGNEGSNWKYESDTFVLSYRNTPHFTTGEMPSYLLFSRVVRDKLPTVPSTVDSLKHDNIVKCNLTQKEEMKTYVDAKRRA